ncbi:3652_t:CDS:2 [Funneliformis caledonium]|uniref:3652_t:CDS:1 n=1 Tax=Funneliformis caledonium TaxID=1117310 RepID=A0A9N9FS04_9GLOM|nr:3652_t:CDS:2 [Funneliformis caledonium]
MKIYNYHHCLNGGNVADFFGITKDPSSNYMFVMKYYEYYEHLDLYSFLDETQGILCWRDIVLMLWQIFGKIIHYHEKGLIHGNIHGGNILVEVKPDSRPTTSELYEKLETWISAIDGPDPSELSEELSNLKKSKFDQQNVHSEAFYTSRFLSFLRL